MYDVLILQVQVRQGRRQHNDNSGDNGRHGVTYRMICQIWMHVILMLYANSSVLKRQLTPPVVLVCEKGGFFGVTVLSALSTQLFNFSAGTPSTILQLMTYMHR
jgi:hypothetical protein